VDVLGVSQREHRLGGVNEGVVLPSSLSGWWLLSMVYTTVCMGWIFECM